MLRNGLKGDKDNVSFTLIGEGVLDLLQVKYMTARKPNIVVRQMRRGRISTMRNTKEDVS